MKKFQEIRKTIAERQAKLMIVNPNMTASQAYLIALRDQQLLGS